MITIPALKGKIVDLGLLPQDFFVANELPIKPNAMELKKWFTDHFFWGVTIPIFEVSRSKSDIGMAILQRIWFGLVR